MKEFSGWRNNAMYCVIVGDIINSRSLEPDVRERVRQAARDIFAQINTKYLGALIAPFGIVRGDAFQGVMLTHHYAPQIVQDIIKAIYQVEHTTVRISVVLERLTTTDADRNETDGPAFHKAIDDMAKMKERRSTHWLQVSFNVGSLGQSLVESQFALLAALTEGWTEKQREIAWAMDAHNGYQKNVSEQLQISPGVVSKQLKAAHYDAYRRAWESLEAYLIAIDEYAVKNESTMGASYVPYFNMAMRKQACGDHLEVLRLLQRSLELAQRNLVTNAPLLIPIYTALAKTYIELGHYLDAEELIQKSLLLQAPMPKARLQYVETLSLEASLYIRQESFEAARKKYQEALTTARAILDDAHPLCLALHKELATLDASLKS